MTDNNSSNRRRAGRPRTIGNPVARSPLLRKGGPHERSASGQRARQRLSTGDAIEEWLAEREAEQYAEDEKGSGSSPFRLYGSKVLERISSKPL
jgi:hypothetical protein